ncbi:hypothetical protein ACMXYV_07745 [Neptuniibacter sp. SY11_33]|uniref:hypothetical protein n=1 Tax=Neptuniibacter sp. SY11_33 TaxID=3398215 RepID=UPI0039F6041A
MSSLSKQLETIWELASDAHTAIQRDFADIDPLIGVSQNMRKQGIPADVMTIDCLRTRRRIIVILHDQQPDIVSYQFAGMDSDPEGDFESLAFEKVTKQTIYEWIAEYFKDPL